MRFDRDAIDRGGAYDRDGTTGTTHLLTTITDTTVDGYARLQIEHLLSVLDEYSICSDFGRNSYDRSGYDRQYTHSTPCLIIPATGSISDTFARLRIDHLPSGYADTICDGWAVLLQSLAGYADTISDLYAWLRIDHLMNGYADTESDLYARLQLSQWLQSVTDNTTDTYARLQITHEMKGYADTVTDTYAMLRQIDSWTITFTGTLAAGETVCINTRDYTVKNNGVNAIADFSGDFPSIFPGTNWVIYTDSEGSRTLRIVVSKRDRKV